MKKKLVLKPFVLPTVYFLSITVLLGVLSFSTGKKYTDYTYVNDSILNNYLPVVEAVDSDKIIKPVSDENVKVSVDFYNSDADKNEQIKSIIKHENTYIQNTGINYISDTDFDVYSILPGEVIEIKDDVLLGKTIVIKHDKNLISVYQSIKDVMVKLNDKVMKNQVIAKGSTSELLNQNKFNLNF